MRRVRATARVFMCVATMFIFLVVEMKCGRDGGVKYVEGLVLVVRVEPDYEQCVVMMFWLGWWWNNWVWTVGIANITRSPL